MPMPRQLETLRLKGAALLAAVALAGIGAILAITGGCSQGNAAAGAQTPSDAERDPYVASLGNLRTGQPLSPAAAQVAVFLFGEEPEPPLGLIKPVELAATADGIIVTDSALQGTLQWTAGNSILDFLNVDQSSGVPSAVAVSPSGDRFIGDLNGPVVRIGADGKIVQHYSITEPMRPGGLAVLGPQLWVSNLRAHRIEVFDVVSGAHVKSIGSRGRGPAEFGLPMGLATTPDGFVCVVDMLNARVQVLNRDGQREFDVGGPGNRIGYFGRPKGVAVGPDGTIFVTDAASQRVHAFDHSGRPLLTFGGPEDGPLALVLPAGIAIRQGPVTAEHAPPGDFTPAYYVLVAEQAARPGIRVYAWSGAARVAEDTSRPAIVRPAAPTVEDPHWNPERCTLCHSPDDGPPHRIPLNQIDALCISCHDGVKSVNERHPIGRMADGPRTKAVPDWPLLDGRLICLTCHDVVKQCSTAAVKPRENAALLRGYNPRDVAAACRNCHAEGASRVNPHRSEVPGLGDSPMTCVFCHTAAPKKQADGMWVFDSRLRGGGSLVCLNCHTMHADPARNGHLDKLVPEAMKRAMAERERGVLGEHANPTGQPALLRLADGRIACYTCHNPHPEHPPSAVLSLFNHTGDLARATWPPDRRKRLRVENVLLCAQCHGRGSPTGLSASIP